MRIVHFFIQDIGGEFALEHLNIIAEKVGSLEQENLARYYSSYYLLSGLAPARVLMRKEEVRIKDIPFSLEVRAKIYSYGVFLLEYAFEATGIEDASLTRVLFQSREYDHPTKGRVVIEEGFHADSALIQSHLGTMLKRQYDPPTIIDRFRLFVDDRLQRPENEIMDIFLPGDEAHENPRRRRVVKRVELWDDREEFFIMGDRAYLASNLESRDILNFLELSRVQLYELQVYDIILDRAIENTYTFIETIPHTHQVFPLVWLQSWYRNQLSMLWKMTELRMDLVDLVKDITNSTKITSDPYFELLYRELNDTFHINEWLKSVNEKIDEIEDVQHMISDRLDENKSTALEMTVIILIAIEVVGPLFTMVHNWVK